MKLFHLILALQFICIISSAQSHTVRLNTSKGQITLLLYDDTPLHRDAFLKSIRHGIYKNAAFNRVIKGFVSQAGELDETILKREQQHPEMPLQRIKAELSPLHYHKKGSLGAGRNENPAKDSYVSQIYLVTGKVHTSEQLDALVSKKNMRFSATQRAAYGSVGGTPHLDGDYTIFGEIISGMEVADEINAVATDANDLPLTPIIFSAEIVKHPGSKKK